MFVETQIKNRPDRSIAWCPDVDSDYPRLLDAQYRYDGRLINAVYQMSENALQLTRTMIFLNRAARDAFFADPIMAALEARAVRYDAENKITVRIVQDGE
jgi:hypothetical protein